MDNLLIKHMYKRSKNEILINKAKDSIEIIYFPLFCYSFHAYHNFGFLFAPFIPKIQVFKQKKKGKSSSFKLKHFK